MPKITITQENCSQMNASDSYDYAVDDLAKAFDIERGAALVAFSKAAKTVGRWNYEQMLEKLEDDFPDALGRAKKDAGLLQPEKASPHLTKDVIVNIPQLLRLMIAERNLNSGGWFDWYDSAIDRRPSFDSVSTWLSDDQGRDRIEEATKAVGRNLDKLGEKAAAIGLKNLVKKAVGEDFKAATERKVSQALKAAIPGIPQKAIDLASAAAFSGEFMRKGIEGQARLLAKFYDKDDLKGIGPNATADAAWMIGIVVRVYELLTQNLVHNDGGKIKRGGAFDSATPTTVKKVFGNTDPAEIAEWTPSKFIAAAQKVVEFTEDDFDKVYAKAKSMARNVRGDDLDAQLGKHVAPGFAKDLSDDEKEDILVWVFAIHALA